VASNIGPSSLVLLGYSENSPELARSRLSAKGRVRPSQGGEEEGKFMDVRCSKRLELVRPEAGLPPVAQADRVFQRPARVLTAVSRAATLALRKCLIRPG
jgi:hypothetical protein